MVSKKSRQVVRENKHRRMRNRFSGTPERPRLAVFRSNNHMYAQIIDDTVGKTLAAASTLEKDVKAELERHIWELLSQNALWKRVSPRLYLTAAATSTRVKLQL